MNEESAYRNNRGEEVKRPGRWRILVIGAASPIVWWNGLAMAVPPAEDLPEEVLRTEMILEARSPVDGKPMTAAEYAQLQTEQQALYQPPAPLSKKVRATVGLLKARKFIKTYLPFIPIK